MSGPASPPDDTPPEPGGATRRTLALGIALTFIVLTGAGILAVAGSPGTGDEVGSPVPDDGSATTLADRVDPAKQAPLPVVRLESFAGAGQITTSDYRGRPLLLNFWASWCPPCVEEMPDLQEVADAAGGRMAVLGVNLTDDQDKAAELVERLGVSYDLAIDPDGDLFAGVEGFGMPTTLFIDPTGEIRYRHTGPLDAEAIAALAAEHLEIDVPLDP